MELQPLSLTRPFGPPSPGGRGKVGKNPSHRFCLPIPVSGFKQRAVSHFQILDMD